MAQTFRKLTESLFVSPQLEMDDIAAAGDQGIALIINNRPDGEDPDAPQGADVEAAAAERGIAYAAIPVGHSGFSEAQVDHMIAALDEANGPVLAYCRSGTRSTLLWALSQAKSGMHPDDIARSAMAAGYDVSPVRAMLDMLAAR